MSYLATFGVSLFFLGVLFLLKSSKNKKFLWAGIPLLIAGALSVFNVTTNVDTNLLGMQVLVDDSQEFIIELHYFPTKEEALNFYKQKKVTEFLLLAKYEGSAADLFKMIDIKQTPDGGKRIAFIENPQKNESAQNVFQSFYMNHKLFTVYNFAKRHRD